MEDQLATAERNVLVELVKVAQNQGMKGTHGGWKEFLNFHDKKFGASISDPSRRPTETLVAFLKTFTDENHTKILCKVMQCYGNRCLLDQLNKDSVDDNDSTELRLLRQTLDHPFFPLDYSFPSHDEEWVVTKLSKNSKKVRSTQMVAVDCEMVLCKDGSEALVRVSVVDHDLQVKLDEFVKPGKAVADYRTEITGVRAGDLDGIDCSLVDVQRSMKKLLKHGTILVGHSLYNDLRALKIDHARVIDTSYIFKYSDAPIRRRPSLNNLCKFILGYEVRKEGAPHNCVDDACAAMRLVLAIIEGGVNCEIPASLEDVPYSQMAKLFLHRIPANMPIEELHRAIPGSFTVEAKPSKSPHGDKFSAFAIFSSPEEANEAFESLEGTLAKDSCGLSQKLIKFKLSTGAMANLYVRKTTHDVPISGASTKRSAGILTPDKSKKLKIEPPIEKKMDTSIEKKMAANQCCDHLKEIERLKEELSERELKLSNQCKDHLQEIHKLKQELHEKDFEISVLNKMVKQQKDVNEKKKKKQKGL